MTIYTHHVDTFPELPHNNMANEVFIDPPKYFEGPGHKTSVLLGAKITARLIESEERSRTDPNTKLANKRGFDESLDAMLLAAEQDPNAQVVLVYFDLDRFKSVNDTYGHDVGDYTLLGFAELLRNNIRVREDKNEILARVGGDEFVAVLNTMHGLQKADSEERRVDLGNDQTVIEGFEQRVLEQIRQLGEDLGIADVNLGVSFGVVRYRDKGHENETPSEFRNRADSEMYEMKTKNKALEEIRTQGYEPSVLLERYPNKIEYDGEEWEVSRTNNLQAKLEMYFSGAILSKNVADYQALFKDFAETAVGKRLCRILKTSKSLNDEIYIQDNVDIAQKVQKNDEWRRKTADERAVLLTFAFKYLAEKAAYYGVDEPIKLVV